MAKTNINQEIDRIVNNAPPVTEARIQLEREAKARRDKEDARRQTELDKEKDMTREPDTNLYRFQKQKRTNKDNDLKEINDSYNRNLKKIQMQFEANGMSVDELNKEIKPKWYDKKGLWFFIGAGSMIGSAILLDKIN